MFIQSFPVGCLACNCTILACETSGECIIIDPGDEKERLVKIVTDNGFKVKYLLHTHAHFDHIGAAGPLKREGFGKILLHKGDDFLYEALEDQGRLFGVELPEKDQVDENIEHKDELEFGNHQLKIIHTLVILPGAAASTCREKRVLFTGDTLFKGSIGRTDLPGGDFQQILESIRGRILNLPQDIQIIPGHGPETNLVAEVKTNPFLKV